MKANDISSVLDQAEQKMSLMMEGVDQALEPFNKALAEVFKNFEISMTATFRTEKDGELHMQFLLVWPDPMAKQAPIALPPQQRCVGTIRCGSFPSRDVAFNTAERFIDSAVRDDESDLMMFLAVMRKAVLAQQQEEQKPKLWRGHNS